jgi:hypothetical protein
MNVGLHCETEKDIYGQLSGLNAYLSAWSEATRPPVLFLHSTSQHFGHHNTNHTHTAGSHNGYYYPEFRDRHCHPTEDLQQAYAQDWRNRLPETFFANNSWVKVVQLDALYSQFDAHVAHGMRYSEWADCTHW